MKTLSGKKEFPGILKNTLKIYHLKLTSEEEALLRRYCTTLDYNFRITGNIPVVTYKNRLAYVQRDQEGRFVLINSVKVLKKGIQIIKEDLQTNLGFFLAYENKKIDTFWNMLFKNGAFDWARENGRIDKRELYGCKYLDNGYQ